MSERRDFLRRARSSSVSLLACPKPTFALPYRDPFSESSATCSPDLLLSPSSSRPPLCAVCQPQLPNLDRTSAPRTTPGRVRAGQATSPKHAQNQHAPAHPHSTRIHASACPASLLLYLTGVLPSGKTPPPLVPTPGRRTGKVVGTTIYTQHPFVLAQVTASHHGTGTNAVLISLTSDLLGLG